MTACSRCGRALVPTDRFCPTCGAPTPAVQAAPPPHSTTGETLILVGSIIGIVVLCFAIFFFAFFSLIIGKAPFDQLPFPFGGFLGLVFLFFIVGVVGDIFSFRGRAQILRGDRATGSRNAIIGGALLMVGGGSIGGILVLVGGILCLPKNA